MIDKRVFYTGGAAVLIVGSCLLVQGCDLQQMIKFDIPGGVQSAANLPEEESIANADYVWEQWEGWVNSNSEKLARNIEDSKSRIAMIENLTSMGVGALGEVSGTFPGGAVAFSGLSLLAGWFLKRPGENKAVAKEKESSYNAGIEKGKAIAEQLKAALNTEGNNDVA